MSSAVDAAHDDVEHAKALEPTIASSLAEAAVSAAAAALASFNAARNMPASFGAPSATLVAAISSSDVSLAAAALIVCTTRQAASKAGGQAYVSDASYRAMQRAALQLSNAVERYDEAWARATAQLSSERSACLRRDSREQRVNEMLKTHAAARKREKVSYAQAVSAKKAALAEGLADARILLLAKQATAWLSARWSTNAEGLATARAFPVTRQATAFLSAKRSLTAARVIVSTDSVTTATIAATYGNTTTAAVTASIPVCVDSVSASSICTATTASASATATAVKTTAATIQIFIRPLQVRHRDQLVAAILHSDLFAKLYFVALNFIFDC